MRSRSALLLPLLALSSLSLSLSITSAGCGVFFGIDDPKHRVPAVCGDGAITDEEVCDDGNSAAGDGCDATCQIEPGFTCTGEPSVCTQCGDGQLEDGETCDDGNQAAGDGCGATCAVEPGFVCWGEPSVCALCGDGLLKGLETCDDGNALTGDGCDASCSTEHGYTCEGEPSTCASLCGDGVVAADEPCDDGNLTKGDGCNATCQVEHGFGCVDEPSICKIACGDGKVGTGEQCDDGNHTLGDGCGANCTRESGFTCDMGEPSVCTATCGDGLVVLGEDCDDANFLPGDGCDASCAVEPGFTCDGQPSDCRPLCGDGVILPGEECDDGNTTSGDCCSAFCKVEPGCEVEPNDTTAAADALASGVVPVGFTGDGKIRGAIGKVGDEDVFAFDLAPAQSVVRIETFDESGTDCPAGTDTKIWLLNSMGVPLPSRSDDDSGIGACSAMEVNLPSGGYYIRVQPSGGAALVAGYTLEVDVQPSAGVESTTGNDTIPLASAFNLTDGFMSGAHQAASDVDFYKITIPGGSPRSLRAEIIEGSAETCESNGIQSRLTLFSADSTPLVTDEDGHGRGLCSLLDGTGMTAANPEAHDLAPGVYYLSVDAAKTATGAAAQFDYRLALTLR